MCPNALSPSLCCSSVAEPSSLSKDTTIIDIHTCPQENNYSNTTYLQSLSSHLDLLTAGSLLLLPSLLPFLASALTADSYSSPLSSSDPLNPAYVSSSAVPVPGTAITTDSAWTWSTTWIMMLPCLGVMVPLSLFKLLAVLEERKINSNGIECPYKRWRQTRAASSRRSVTVRRVMMQSNCRHGAADGPTLKAIKRVWRNFVKAPNVDDDNNSDFLGYAPLPMVHQDKVSAEEGLCVSSGEVDNEKKGMHQVDSGNIHTHSNNRRRRQPKQQLSALPRPKTILLASLWAWTLLMTLSAKMGFNSLEQISVPPSFAVSTSSPMTGPGLVPTHMIQGGSSVSGAPIFILPPSMPFPADLQPLETQEEEQDADIDLRSWEPTSDLWSAEEQQQQQQHGESGADAIVALLDMDIDVQFDVIEALWAQDQPTAAGDKDEEAQPFARIQTSIVIMSGNNMNSNTAPSTEHSSLEDAEIEADIEDMSSLDSMIMDPQDEAVFHDFLYKLDEEDQALEQAQDQQRRKLFKATDDLMVSSMLENDLPCGYYNRRSGSAGLFSDNKWLAGLQQFFIGDSMSAANVAHYPGRTFVYTGWSTDLMIVAVAMCLGGVLVGLAQSKILYHQLLDQHVASSFSTTFSVSLRRRASWTTILVSFSLCTSALALTFLMIADESWDVPAIYFVGIGIAGIILVHAWAPNAMLIIHSHRNTTADSSSDDEDDEDTCIGSDEDEDSKLFSPISSPSADEHSFVWSPPMAERRNACSLDENRRREVVAAAAISHETTCYTR